MIDSERVEEILEGQLENKNSGDSITTKKELSERTEREGVGDEDIYTETSTGSGRVAMPIEYLQNIGRGSFRTMRVGEDDVILNLGAPQPHLSGIGMKVSGEAAGAEVLTLHAGEVDEIIDRADEVTTVVSLPGMARAKGHEVQEKYGDPREVFDPDTALLAGEIITESWRETLSEQWGFNNTNEIYASSEAGPILAELDSPGTQRKLLPQLDEAVIEVYPLGSEENPQEINSGEVDPEELVDIREIEEETEGIMYPTVPSMFTRYDQGD